ncbi:MAG: alpha/beta fold hydrolase [Pseudomonadota bacterium]
MHLRIDADNALFYLQKPPGREGAPSFVFVNALTGDTGTWEAEIAPALRAAGFGTLSYNFRGQAESVFAPGLALTPDLIVEDLQRLLAELAPTRPILVGLSIGGLFAAQALLRGSSAAGLVLLNTLREIGPRIAWVNDALPALVAHGGVGLFLDALMPLLVNGEFAETARAARLQGGYAPMEPDHGHLNLMRHAGAADWSVDWGALSLPVLNITGLQDRVFLDRAVVERLLATIPNHRCEDWTDCGHLIPQERGARLVERLIAFGREIEAGR